METSGLFVQLGVLAELFKSLAERFQQLEEKAMWLEHRISAANKASTAYDENWWSRHGENGSEPL